MPVLPAFWLCPVVQLLLDVELADCQVFEDAVFHLV
jgi:hypothetical protein